MRKAKTPADPMALPLQKDTALLRLAEGEAGRTLATTAEELRAAELLSLVTGMTAQQAEMVLRKAGGMYKLAQLPDYVLETLPHVGPKRAKKIRGMTDWAVMLSASREPESLRMQHPMDIAKLVMVEMGLLDKEQLRVVALDTKHHVVDVETVYHGSVNSVAVRIAEVFRLPITRQCPSMVLIHNHPSGDPTPSPEDVRLTELVVDTGKRLDVDLLDHLIIGRNRFVSLKERGLGFS